VRAIASNVTINAVNGHNSQLTLHRNLHASDQLGETQCYWLATAAMTSRMALCCHLFSSTEITCKLAHPLARAQSVNRLTTVENVFSAGYEQYNILGYNAVSTDNSEAQRHLHQGRKHKFGKNPA
jgi:hypothetical protein